MTVRRIEIETPEFLKGVLSKDLCEDEVICEDCAGTGLRVVDYKYGIRGEVNSRVHFPYNNQTISRCHHCYNGVRKKCELCGELLNVGTTKCNCEGYKFSEWVSHTEKEIERFDEATKISYKDYIKQFPDYMIYCEDNGKYYSELEELEEEHQCDGLTLPKYVYGTYKISIGIDVDSVIENACDDLHEEAMYDLEGENELRSAIDDFNLKNERRTATYYPNYELAVLL